MKIAEIRPKAIDAFRNYDRRDLPGDLIAGLTVGLVALPLAMAFAISSGVAPQAGIYTAIVAGLLVSLLGGSRCQIAGPTGAFVVVVYGIVQKHGMDGLYMCTLLAGLMLVLLGVTGLGAAVKYIPRPVVIGFTNGIAVLIASTQIKDFFGLDVAKVPGEFLGRMEVLLANAARWNPTAFALGLTTLVGILVWNRFVKRVPGAIVALIGGTGVAWALNLPVETIQSRFGGIPAGLPTLHIPQFRPDLILEVLSPAVTVAMLGAIESLLSAVVADRMSGDRHSPNTELFAQGIANVVSPLVGGIPATGAIARTAANIRNGAKSPLAGVIHALTLLVIVLVAAPLAKHIPLAVLSALLFVVAYNMGEWKEIPAILRMSTADIAVWAVTFALTVLADLTLAVEVGMILAALLYITRVTNTTTVDEITPEYVESGDEHSLQKHPLPEGVAAFRIGGPFLFGASEKLQAVEDQADHLPRVVLLRLRNMTAIDATGLHAIEQLADALRRRGKTLVICGLRDQPDRLMRRAEFDRHLGAENIQPSLAAAIRRAEEILSSSEASSRA